MKRNRINCDTLMWGIALTYVILPVIVFLAFWTRFICAICGITLMMYLSYRCIKIAGEQDEIRLITAQNKKFWVISAVCICLWVYLAGIGNMAYQNDDFWVRNPIYNDLRNLSWPIYYNLDEQPYGVTQLIGGGNVAFAYYCTWWLTPAAICKVLGLGQVTSQVLLYFYAVMGVYIAYYFVCRLVRSCSWKCMAVFVFFSGMDLVAYLLKKQGFPLMTEHIEWACGLLDSEYLFQYSGNTTQLFWVFNQSIPVWIITAMVMSLPETEVIGGLEA